MKTIHSYFVFIFLICNYAGYLSAQVLMDQGLRVEGLWCFPSKEDPSNYYYLPAEAKLGMQGNTPQFSFMRYVDLEAEGNGNNSILQAKGGGVLHFLVHYETSEAQLEATREELAYVSGDHKAKLKGPIIFKEGSYALISSIVNPEEGGESRKLMAKGRAPVLEGNKIALSFELDAKDSKLLLESFKMATPDISLVFDLAFEGLSNAYDASLEIDWSEVQKRHEASVGGSYLFIGAEAGLEIDELMKNQSIKLTTNGEDDHMDQLMDTVMEKLLAMLFEQAPENSSENEDSIMDMLTNVMGNSNENSKPSSSPFGIGFKASYQYKEVKKSGKSSVMFNSRLPIERHHFVTFNIGNLYKKFKNNERVFKTFSMEDEDFQLRELKVGIDGTLYQEFDKMVNNVTVMVRKEHQNEEVSLRSLLVNKSQFDKNNAEPFSLTYGSKGDDDRLQWLNYEYKTIWQFQGGAIYETEWQTASASMINLFSPFERTKIQLSGDMEELSKKNYRAVAVQLEYPFFGKIVKLQKIIQPKDDLHQSFFEITLPLDNRAYTYTLTWLGKNQETISKSNTDSSGIIFLDEFPNNE